MTNLVATARQLVYDASNREAISYLKGGFVCMEYFHLKS